MQNFKEKLMDLLVGSREKGPESGYFHKLRAYEDNTASFPEEELDAIMDLVDELDKYLEKERPVLAKELFQANYLRNIFLVETSFALASTENAEVYERFYHRMVH